MIYAGIGSRKTPPDILNRMKNLATVYATRGFVLRSGGAQGADTAFEQGCDFAGGKKEIFLPWKGYNGRYNGLYTIPKQAYVIAEQVYGPRWQYLKDPIKHLMARNIQQIMGKNLDTNVDFVICWTEDGAESTSQRSKRTGGTGQAIACASDLGIPVLNMKNFNLKEILTF